MKAAGGNKQRGGGKKKSATPIKKRAERGLGREGKRRKALEKNAEKPITKGRGGKSRCRNTKGGSC